MGATSRCLAIVHEREFNNNYRNWGSFRWGSSTEFLVGTVGGMMVDIMALMQAIATAVVHFPQEASVARAVGH